MATAGPVPMATGDNNASAMVAPSLSASATSSLPLPTVGSQPSALTEGLYKTLDVSDCRLCVLLIYLFSGPTQEGIAGVDHFLWKRQLENAYQERSVSFLFHPSLARLYRW
jgi:hypothetical protein